MPSHLLSPNTNTLGPHSAYISGPFYCSPVRYILQVVFLLILLAKASDYSLTSQREVNPAQWSIHRSCFELGTTMKERYCPYFTCKEREVQRSEVNWFKFSQLVASRACILLMAICIILNLYNSNSEPRSPKDPSLSPTKDPNNY